MRTSVVLPAPLGPIRVRISPLGNVDVDALQDGATRARQPQRARAEQRIGIVRERLAGVDVGMMMLVIVLGVGHLPAGRLAQRQLRPARYALPCAGSRPSPAQVAHSPHTSTTAPLGGTPPSPRSCRWPRTPCRRRPPPRARRPRRPAPAGASRGRHGRQRRRCGFRSDARGRPPPAPRWPGRRRSAPAARRARPAGRAPRRRRSPCARRRSREIPTAAAASASDPCSRMPGAHAPSPPRGRGRGRAPVPERPCWRRLASLSHL